MRKIAITMQKGGVGKTTVAVNTAVGLARRGRKVLFLDLDWQANATDALGARDCATGMYDLLRGDIEVQDAIVSVEENLDLIPSSRNLAEIEEWLTSQMRREETLRRRLRDVEGYDLILADTGPGYTLVNINALQFVEEVWLVVTAEYFGLEGTAKMVETVEMVKDVFERDLKIGAVVPNLVETRTVKCRESLENLELAFPGLVTPPIRKCVQLGESPGHHQSIWDYGGPNNGRRDFRSLIKHLKENCDV